MAPESLVRELLGVLEKRASEHGVDIVDLEVVGSRRAPVVRVRIDHADEGAPTITLDEVSAETSWISDAIDEVDPIGGPFTLEVSSPGMARPLRKERDFARFAGQTVSLTTTATEGRRRFTGMLGGMRDGSVILTVDGDEVAIPFAEVRSCKIKPSFE